MQPTRDFLPPPPPGGATRPARQDQGEDLAMRPAEGGPNAIRTHAGPSSRPAPVSRAVAEGAALLDVNPARAARPAPEPRLARAKPDPNPIRLLLGLAGLASASALTTAMLPSILPAQTPVTVQTVSDAAAVPQPAPSVIHITKVVQLVPGQSAPPNTSVQIAPAPTPIVRVVTVTRQSGKP
jgi:hypothetical protein